MVCEVCEWIKEKKNIVFEDDSVFLMFSPYPASAGHMLVVPKKHAPILETLDDPLIERMFNFANMGSVCSFESFGAVGTNVIVQNGVPAGQSHNHCFVHVIPRYENDGLDFSWETKQMGQEQLDGVFAKFIAEDVSDQSAGEMHDDKSEKQDYRLKFRRIP